MKSTAPLVLLLVLLLAAGLTVAPTAAYAQMGGVGGMGGMGGAGGMQGGMGRGGMRGGPPGGGNRRSPADMMKERLKQANTLEFLLDHKKPLALTSRQQDSIKSYRKEVERLQKPLFASLSDVMGDAMMRGQRGAGAAPGQRGERGEGDAEGGNPMDRFLPDTAKVLVTRLEDIQQAFGDRARALLDATQRQRADSIQTVKLEAQRAKMREQMEQRRRG